MPKKDLNKVIFIVGPTLTYGVLGMVGFSSWLIGDSYPNINVDGEAGDIVDERLKFTYNSMVNSKINFDSFAFDSAGSVTSSVDSNEQLEIQLRGVLDGYNYENWSLLRFNIRIEPQYRTKYRELIDLGYFVEPSFNDLYKDDTNVTSIITTYGSYWTGSVINNSRQFTLKYAFSWGSLFNYENPSIFFDSEHFNGIKKGNSYTYKEKKEILNNLNEINGAKYSLYLDSVDLNSTHKVIFNSNGGSFSSIDNSSTITKENLINHDKIIMPSCYKDSFKFVGWKINDKTYKQGEEVYIDQLFNGITNTELTLNAEFEDLRTSGTITVLSGANYASISASLCIYSSKYGSSITPLTSSTTVSNVLIGDKILICDKVNVSRINYIGLSDPNADGWQTIQSSNFSITIIPDELCIATINYTCSGTKLDETYFEYNFEVKGDLKEKISTYLSSKTIGKGRYIKITNIHGVENFSISGLSPDSDGYYYIDQSSVTINIVCSPSYNLTFNNTNTDKNANTPKVNFAITNSEGYSYSSNGVAMGTLNNIIVSQDIITISGGNNLESYDGPKTVSNANITMNVKSTTSSSCLTSDTLVLLSDHSYKKISEIKIEDKVLVFNHFTGKLEEQELAIIYKNGCSYGYIKLTFENGKILKLVGCHGIFNLSKKQYTFFTYNNCYAYLNDYFAYFGNNKMEYVRLISVEVIFENVESYSLDSKYHYNIIAEGLLTVSETPINFIDLDENLVVLKENLEVDINKYGLFSYEEWKDIMPYSFFEYYGVKFMTIAIAKGVISKELLFYGFKYLLNLIEKGNAIINDDK